MSILLEIPTVCCFSTTSLELLCEECRSGVVFVFHIFHDVLVPALEGLCDGLDVEGLRTIAFFEAFNRVAIGLRQVRSDVQDHVVVGDRVSVRLEFCLDFLQRFNPFFRLLFEFQFALHEFFLEIFQCHSHVWIIFSVQFFPRETAISARVVVGYCTFD